MAKKFSFLTLLRKNAGMLVLSIVLVVCTIVLADQLGTLSRSVMHDETTPEQSDPMKMDLTTNGNDVTYNTELKIGEGESLEIISASYQTIRIRGKNIIARYYHVSGLMTVEYDEGSDKIFRYFNKPVSWRNMP
jgi:hypothetical protein